MGVHLRGILVQVQIIRLPIVLIAGMGDSAFAATNPVKEIREYSTKTLSRRLASLAKHYLKRSKPGHALRRIAIELLRSK